jgi:UrcA family protein
MKNITARIAGVATLALAILPVAALSTAHAETATPYFAERVHIADLNLASGAGKATFAQRVDQAAQRFCRNERSLDLRAACQAAVRTEANEKAGSTVQMASRI